MAKHILTRLLAGLAATVMLVPTLNNGMSEEKTVKNAAAADNNGDDWLHVNDKAQIVDKDGNEVWMTGVNWFGYNVGSQIFDGAWSANVHDCLDLIADHGFNLLRVPMSTEILLQWKAGKPDPIIKLNEYKNPELTIEGVEGGTPMYSFDIWNKVVEWCKEDGLKIMMDVHCATTNSAGHNFPLWYDSSFSEKDWLDALSWFADYYKDDDTIIAIDLKNEPHGKKDEGSFAKWDGSTDANNWRYGAEKGAKACLDKNPNLLIMVEGIEVYPKFDKGFDWNSPSTDYAHYGESEYQPYYGAWWGANFRGARDYPVDLGKYQSQLVYSPHDYGPEVWEQEWFYLDDPSKTFTRQTLLDDYWYDTWAYLVEENISPLLIGEWGGWVDKEHDETGENVHWMQELRDYMIDKHIHHTFWCFNENSSDTGGLVYDNFQKWDDVKYDFIKPALWQTNDGKFISLDHQIPLGTAGNGISLSDYYSGNTDPKPRTTTTTTTTSATTTTTTSAATTTTSSSTTTTSSTTTSTTTTTTTAPDPSVTTTTWITESPDLVLTGLSGQNTSVYSFDKVETYPTKTVYTQGASLDLSGISFKAGSKTFDETFLSEISDQGSFNKTCYIVGKDGKVISENSDISDLPEGKYTVMFVPRLTNLNRLSIITNVKIAYEITIEKKSDVETTEIGNNSDKSTAWGDANCDGQVDMADAVLIMQSLANPNKYGIGGTDEKAITEKGKTNADVDTSTKGITSNDALQIQLYLLKKIATLNPNG